MAVSYTHLDVYKRQMLEVFADKGTFACAQVVYPTKPYNRIAIEAVSYTHLITIDSKQKGCLTWEETLVLGENVSLEEVYRRAQSLNRHDVCNMQYTSGTTGFPKGVMLTLSLIHI